MQASLFVKEKGRALTEYQRERKKIFSAVAGRGFSFEPGFLYDVLTNLEIDIKMGLSEINYKILEEAVARELKERGLDYDLEYKAAALAWAIEKAGLLSDLEKEIADIKNMRDMDEGVIKLLAIEVSKRAILLLQAKTAIELELEGYRQQLANLDAATGDYEVAIAEAKVLTAQKKLDAIPLLTQLIEIERQIFEKDFSISQKEEIILGKNQTLIAKNAAIIDKEGQIVEMERGIVNDERDLISVEQEVIASKEDLINAESELIAIETSIASNRVSVIRPALQSFISTLNLYVAELDTQLDLYQQILDVKTAGISIKEELLAKEQVVLDKKKEVSNSIATLTGLLEGVTEYKMSELVPTISNLLVAYKEDLTTKQTRADLKISISDIKKEAALLIDQQTEKDIAIIDAEQEKLIESISAKNKELELKQQALDHQISKLDIEVDNFTAYKTAWELSKIETDTKRAETFSTVEANRKLERETGFNIRIENSTATENAQRSAIIGRSQSNISRIQGETNAKVNIQEVTARLNHILSQG